MLDSSAALRFSPTCSSLRAGVEEGSTEAMVALMESIVIFVRVVGGRKRAERRGGNNTSGIRVRCVVTYVADKRGEVMGGQHRKLIRMTRLVQERKGKRRKAKASRGNASNGTRPRKCT